MKWMKKGGSIVSVMVPFGRSMMNVPFFIPFRMNVIKAKNTHRFVLLDYLLDCYAFIYYVCGWTLSCVYSRKWLMSKRYLKFVILVNTYVVYWTHTLCFNHFEHFF
ncbi:MAG: hypothetical protein A4E63_01201 [Syntrophorhabdus sp. PtaU1.Bin050]|nr:MAG: hypothetical protein A4E63_01201 [Syntrophorhabdus sp. PtaU1.Bin050]